MKPIKIEVEVEKITGDEVFLKHKKHGYILKQGQALVLSVTPAMLDKYINQAVDEAIRKVIDEEEQKMGAGGVRKDG